MEKIIHKKGFIPKKKRNEFGPFFTAIPYPAYTIATGVAGVLPINISFYTHKVRKDTLADKGKISFFNNNFQFTQYKQIIALSWSNLYFGHDKWELIGDWRFFHFPTFTFGLGSFSNLTDIDNIDYYHLRIYQMILHRVAPDMDVGIGYHLDYHWDIDDLTADAGGATDMQQYGFSQKTISSGLSLNYIYDNRSNPNNAKRGVYFSFQFRTNLKAFAGTSNWNSITLDLRKYVPFTDKWNAGVAFWASASFTLSGKPPYLDLPGTGSDTYNNSGRGYALGRFRGMHFLYFESEFRFSLMRNGLLGGVVFANMQSASEYPQNNFAVFQPGGGIGLRVKINKRTDTNTAVDYGFGTGGSRGFAFNINEVF